MMSNLAMKFETILKSRSVLLPGERVWVACSGGPDSVALFHLLVRIRETWKIRLGIIHFHHGIRGKEADQDEKFVHHLAARYGVPFYGGRAQVRLQSCREDLSLEEAARKARYDFFIQMAKIHRIKKIALAHTLDDQSETVMMRILQGTGLRGLSGILPRMEMQGIVFIRPFLEIPKQELLNYLKSQKILFRRDKSNQSVRFVRNRIRLKLLPWLRREFNPKVMGALARIPSIVRDENELLKEIEEKTWRVFYRSRRGKKLFLNKNFFLSSQPALQFRLLNRALKAIDHRSGLSYEAWQRLKSQLFRKRYTCSLPRDIDLSLTPLRLVLYKK